jgi:hypothetical protein
MEDASGIQTQDMIRTLGLGSRTPSLLQSFSLSFLPTLARSIRFALPSLVLHTLHNAT